MRRPASQFYWSDWLSCCELRAVSVAARGLWIDMLAFMRQGTPVGHLTHKDGRAITPDQLARMVGESPELIRQLLAELEAASVPGKTDAGVYFSRRMVRDEVAYQDYIARQAESGKRGAAARWGSPSPPHAIPQANPTEKAWGKHASSSSSSSSERTDCAEPMNGSTPPLLVFPCRGKGPTEWALTAEQIAEWEPAYPGLDVLGECRRARVWIVANPTKRKTASGLPRFLVTWLNHAVDRPGGFATSTPPAPSAAELEQRRNTAKYLGAS